MHSKKNNIINKYPIVNANYKCKKNMKNINILAFNLFIQSINYI